MARLQQAVNKATTADLQRAAQLLEFAYDVRKGCAKQRGTARRAQSQAWKRNVDEDIRW